MSATNAPADLPVGIQDAIGDLCTDTRAKLAVLTWLGQTAAHHEPGGSEPVRDKLLWRGLELFARDVIREVEDLGILAEVLDEHERMTRPHGGAQ